MSDVSFADFKKLDIRVGKVLSVERVPDTEKLYKVQIDIGEEKPRQTVTSLVDYYTSDELLEREVVVLTNSSYAVTNNLSCSNDARRAVM
ncbi:MAG: hypothetical protein B0D91_14530 [Oceanospirillales bacterium LUC14_002_19_P2]|nr:MAG: hypothetical protein B0D91_14530 [Oceanospirillales bacterium LUC14_002_19_P2]